MTFWQTTALGAIAGFTIFLGLPLGRFSGLRTHGRAALSMLSAGILAFLFMDVGAEALGTVESRLESFKAHEASMWAVVGLFSILSLGFIAGITGPATLQRRLSGPARRLPPLAGGESTAFMSPAELTEHRRGITEVERQALRTGMTIAAAIGVHNFAEGLAIGVSAQADQIGLATVLIVGFALHNATEGFGIVGPLGSVRPTWRWLGLAGLIAGGPTLVGTMVGFQVTSDAVALLFLAVAGGAILYVIGEIWSAAQRRGNQLLGLYLMGTGFLLGIATDLVVAYGGG